MYTYVYMYMYVCRARSLIGKVSRRDKLKTLVPFLYVVCL